jgi:hypothetical protein
MMLIIASMVVVTGFAVAGAKRLRRRLVNLGIIVGSTCIGFGIGYVVVGGPAAMPMGLSVGAAGALGCSIWNEWRTKESRD